MGQAREEAYGHLMADLRRVRSRRRRRSERARRAALNTAVAHGRGFPVARRFDGVATRIVTDPITAFGWNERLGEAASKKQDLAPAHAVGSQMTNGPRIQAR